MNEQFETKGVVRRVGMNTKLSFKFPHIPTPPHLIVKTFEETQVEAP